MSTPKSTNSVVLDQILTQIDRQDEVIKNLQRTAKSQKEVIARHEELIQQQQLLLANLLNQQSLLMNTMVSVNDKQIQQDSQKQQQQQQLPSSSSSSSLSSANNNLAEYSPTTTTTTTTTNTTNTNNTTQHEQQQLIHTLNNKIALMEQQMKDFIEQQRTDKETISVINLGYQQQSSELDKANAIIQGLKMELSLAQSDLNKLNGERNMALTNQVMKIKPVHETLDQQLNRLETDIQTHSKTGIQLIIKTLVGRAMIVDCDISDTISFVKNKIAELGGIPLKDQILLYDGRELNNEHSILKLGLLNQTTLHLILKNRAL